MEIAVFIVAAAIILVGALGVILFRNPVHAALSLVATLFGVAVLFIAQEAHLLAAVQVMVYAGAIVVLFLFVLMLLGVDKAENINVEPLRGQRPVALVTAAATLGLLLIVLLRGTQPATGGFGLTEPIEGQPPAAAEVVDGAADPAAGDVPANVDQLARVLFTDYVFAFEATALLLTVAVVGAVVLARRPPSGQPLLDEVPVPTTGPDPDPDPDVDAGDDAGSDDAGSDDGEGGA